jgi:uncharacterized protein YdeI (YjbR/CyaY-like superfamily)
MARPEPRDIHWFESPVDLRTWLEASHATAPDLWVGFRPKAAGLPTLTWHDLVDEVLCYGWIDGVRMPADGGSCIRVTPRRDGSIWSARNVGRVEALRAEGRMRPAGLAAFGRRRDDRTAVYSHEREADLEEAALAAMQEREGAFAFWEAQPRGYRRAAAHWIVSAKREDTRAKRLAALVDGCAAGIRLVELTGKARAPKEPG